MFIVQNISQAEHFINVNVELDKMDVTKSECKATYEEIKAWILEKYDLKVPNLYIAQVKAEHGIIEQKNHRPSQNSEYNQRQCPPKTWKIIEEALGYFKMI